MSFIKDIVENPHPIYRHNLDKWNFFLQSYEGGADYTGAEATKKGRDELGLTVKVNGKDLRTNLTNNLFQHKKERSDDYFKRLRQSYYYNFCAPIIDIYTDHLFKQPIDENWGNIEKAVMERQEDINRMGSSIHEFRKETADLAQIYGHIFVLTDNPQVEGNILSLQEKMDAGAFPFFTHFHPQKVINWSLDSFGEPWWVVVCETMDSNRDPFNFDKNSNTTLQYRLWTRTEWFLFNAAFEEIESGVHGLNRVPIKVVFDKKSKKVSNFLGVSAITDIAYIARDVYNSCSELGQILKDQTFAFLALQGKSSEYNELSVGTSKGLIYPEDRNVPQYISPDKANADAYFEHIDRQVRKMFQLAKLEGGSAHQQEQIKDQSGIAKAFDFHETNSALSKKASSYEDGENKIWSDFAAWEGQDWDGSIRYPNEFNVQELMDDLEEAEKLFKLNLGTTFTKEVKKAIVNKKFPRLEQDMEDAIIGEIDGQVEAGTTSLRDKFPNFFNNANSGGNGGVTNGTRSERTGTGTEQPIRPGTAGQ